MADPRPTLDYGRPADRPFRIVRVLLLALVIGVPGFTLLYIALSGDAPSHHGAAPLMTRRARRLISAYHEVAFWLTANRESGGRLTDAIEANDPAGPQREAILIPDRNWDQQLPHPGEPLAAMVCPEQGKLYVLYGDSAKTPPLKLLTVEEAQRELSGKWFGPNRQVWEFPRQVPEAVKTPSATTMANEQDAAGTR